MTRATTPIELDLDRIEDALRQLATMAWERRLARGGSIGQPIPNMPDTEIGGIIADPIAGGVLLAHRVLCQYLALTVGPAAAAKIDARIVAEMMPRVPEAAPADAAKH